MQPTRGPVTLLRLSMYVLVVLLAAAVLPAPTHAGTLIPTLPTLNAADFTPRVVDDGYAEAGVKEFQQVGGTMYAGGEFRTVRNAAGTAFLRDSLFSFNPSTGVISDWRPRINGNVYAMEPSADGRYLYVGGGFTTFDGIAMRNLVRIELSTLRVDTAFRPAVGRVTDLELVRGKLFVSGIIVGGLQALDPVTGARDAAYFSATQAAGAQTGYSTRVYRFAVDPAESRLVLIGVFTSIGGQPRQQVAVLNLGPITAAVSPWYSPRWDETCASSLLWYTRDVDFAPDGSNFVVVTSGAGFPGTPKLCDTITRWESVDLRNQQPTWINYSGGDTFHSVTATDQAIFVSGHFRWLDNPLGRDTKGPGAVDRRGIGAVSPTTGKALGWNPGKSIEGGLGGYDLFFNAQGLWIGCHERVLAGEIHEGMGLLPY